MSRFILVGSGLLLLGLFLSGESAAQEVRASEVRVSPTSVAIGSPFSLVIRISVPPGVEFDLPDTLSHLSGAVATGIASLQDGMLEYPLLALRPGVLELPPLRLRLTDPQGRSGWASVPLGSVHIGSVLPPLGEGVEVAPPILLPEPTTSRTQKFALAACLISLTTAFGAWFSGRSLVDKGTSGKPSVPAGFSKSPVISPQEARRKLNQLLAEDERQGSGPGSMERTEEALSLFRIVVVGDNGALEPGQTTPEILCTRGEFERTDSNLLKTILEEDDRMRFEGLSVSRGRASEALVLVRTWLGESHA